VHLLLIFITLVQDDAGQHFARGRELAQQGLYEEAIDEFEKADRIAESPAVLIELAVAYEKVDRCQAALNTWEKLAKTEMTAEQRAQLGERMTAQRWRLSHNECKDGSKKTLAEPTRGRHRRRESTPEPEGPVDHHAWAFGFRIGVVFGRIGASDELEGAVAGSTALENVAGLNLRLALQIPLVRAADKTPILQLEPFFAWSWFSFNTPIQLVDTGGTPLTMIQSGNAMLPLLGVAARFSIPLSTRTELVPALGFGVGWQMISLDTDTCRLSTSLASPVMTFDLPLRYNTDPHHALYFTPASLYVIFPPGSDGDSVDSACFGLSGAGTATSKALYKLDQTKVNYAIDVGYMYQF
jgi:hypothetical protein